MSSDPQVEASFEATIAGFLRRQRTKPTPLPSDLRIPGQTAIVTGSNVGLGLAASRQLLALGLSNLVMGVRSQAKGDAAAAQLRDEFPDSQVSVWTLDMESYDSVRSFAERCASLPRIDVVILNAGLIAPSYTTVPATGHELTMQVNYLSTALLTLLLIPVLKSKRAPGAPRPPVLTIVGSDAAYIGSLESEGPVLAQLDQPKGYEQFSRYSTSKLMLTLFVGELAELVDPDDVLINLCNPGPTKGTSFGHSNSAIVKRVFGVILYFFARSVDVGASIYLDATLTRGAESHGKFISDWAIKPWVGDRLMEETMKELEPMGASLPRRP
ncbi:putative short-chain dehydrogenase reductase family [Diaporthe ampelina]|uniref:Putative short-chain dehydrogenase reductase family n=1 Tax=Diaporthe ampelina TaxID=1214573 RepID=A0A0G2H477_9PEZI|nr:putative short-chain dehydrogenase reductase family [Diaporthe ampelina]